MLSTIHLSGDKTSPSVVPCDWQTNGQSNLVSVNELINWLNQFYASVQNLLQNQFMRQQEIAFQLLRTVLRHRLDGIQQQYSADLIKSIVSETIGGGIGLAGGICTFKHGLALPIAQFAAKIGEGGGNLGAARQHMLAQQTQFVGNFVETNTINYSKSLESLLERGKEVSRQFNEINQALTQLNERLYSAVKL